MTTNKTELSISRFINASPARVWNAWSDPRHLEKWWIPHPMECKVLKLDLRPGGGLETLMREGTGDFGPHVTGCFLDIVPEQRMVWTTCLSDGWQPAEPWLAVTADISFIPEGTGTIYSARVLHKNAEDCKKHDDLGFEMGWGTAIEQLGVYLQKSN